MINKNKKRHPTKAGVKSVTGGPTLTPAGFESAPRINNKKLASLLAGPDISINGGTHSVVKGQPLAIGHGVQK